MCSVVLMEVIVVHQDVAPSLSVVAVAVEAVVTAEAAALAAVAIDQRHLRWTLR